MQSTGYARWYGVMTLFFLIAISYVDRINIAVLITDIDFLQHIGLEATDRAKQGLLATAFMLGYGISSVVLTPFAAALLGVRRSLMLGLCLWGVVTFVSPLMTSYGMLLASRILLGLSEGPVFALASAYIKAYFESHENGRPNALVNMGTGLGLAVGFPFVSYLVATYSWDNSFYVLGLINICLGLPLVLAFIKMPASEMAQTGRPLARVQAMVRGALHTPHLLAMTLLTAAFMAYLWGSSNWLPAYLKEAHGMSMRDMGLLASLPPYATVVAVFVGGLLIDKMPRRNVPLIFVAGAVGVSLAILAAINAATGHGTAYAIVVANFCWGLMSPCFPSTVQFFSKPEHIASAYGVTNGLGSLAAGFMPAIMGYVISRVAAGDAASGAGFAAGFAALIGTQVIVALIGIYLYLATRRRERMAVESLSKGVNSY